MQRKCTFTIIITLGGRAIERLIYEVLRYKEEATATDALCRRLRWAKPTSACGVCKAPDAGSALLPFHLPRSPGAGQPVWQKRTCQTMHSQVGVLHSASLIKSKDTQNRHTHDMILLYLHPSLFNRNIFVAFFAFR